MMSRDPEGAVSQYGRLSWRQLGFLLTWPTWRQMKKCCILFCRSCVALPVSGREPGKRT